MTSTRWRLLGALLWLGMMAGRAAPLRAVQDGEPSEMVVRLRIDRLIDQMIFGYARDSTLLLPLGQFTELVEILVDDVIADRRFGGLITPERVPFLFDTEAGSLTVGDTVIRFASSAAIWRDRELFVDATLVARAFGIDGYMDWTELQYHIRATERLPVIRRLKREKRRDVLGRRDVREVAVPLPTLHPPIDGGAVEWGLTVPTRSPVGNATVRLGLGTTVGGGSLDLRYTQFTGASNTALLDWSWVRAWPKSRIVKQVHVGEIGITGRMSTFVTGASVTNAPYLRPVSFADEILSGYFPDGWEVEVYRGEQLVGFTTVDRNGRYAVSLPVRYGPNPVTLVAYGPRGEMMRAERTFDIPFLRLPGGQFEYGLSAGACQGRCGATVNVDTRYGITDRVTVQLGTDFFTRDTLPDRVHPYALASFAATRALSFTAEGVLNGLGRARADFNPTPNLSVSAAHTWFDNSDPAPFVGSVFERNRSEVHAFWRPGLSSERFFFEGQARRSVLFGRTQYFGSVASSIRWSGARLTTELFREWSTGSLVAGPARTGVELSSNTLLPHRWGVLGNTLLRSRARMEMVDGVTALGLGIGRQFHRAFRLDLDLDWNRRGRGLTLNMGLTAVLPRFRATSRNVYSKLGGLRGAQHFEGSLLYNRLGESARLTNISTLGRSGISGDVFLDENGDGVHGPDEMGVEGVRVNVGGRAVRTDAHGRFDLWDLVPFERTVIEIDTLSISNPTWIPAIGPAYIHPTPNSYQPVSLALLQGGEVIGSVEFGETGRGLAGASVLLQHEETGEVTRVLTFSDGTFYVLGLRPGIYEATLPFSLLERMNVSSHPVRFLVGTGEEAFLEGVTLRIFENNQKR